LVIRERGDDPGAQLYGFLHPGAASFEPESGSYGPHRWGSFQLHDREVGGPFRRLIFLARTLWRKRLKSVQSVLSLC
jgi:hypothetical protein